MGISLPDATTNGANDYFEALARQDHLLFMSRKKTHMIRGLLEIIDTHCGALKSADFPAEVALIAEARAIK